jgi:hypothetical protein
MMRNTHQLVLELVLVEEQRRTMMRTMMRKQHPQLVIVQPQPLALKKTTKVQVRKNGRVKVQKKNLYHIVQAEEQRNCLSNQPKNKNYFGTVISGNVKQHYTVRFDDFPYGFQEVRKVRRAVIKAVAPGEEEKEFDHVVQDASDPLEMTIDETDRNKTAESSVKEFCSLPKETIAEAKVFDFHYGSGPEEYIKWEIMGDTEYIGERDELLKVPERAEFKRDIAYDPSNEEECDYNKVFFEEFFPSIEGHAKIMDDFLSNPISPYFATVKADKIKFHDESHPVALFVACIWMRKREQPT